MQLCYYVAGPRCSRTLTGMRPVGGAKSKKLEEKRVHRVTAREPHFASTMLGWLVTVHLILYYG